MIKTTPLSQRDPRWANVILGFGTGTIGQYGCTLTALTMLLNSKGANLNPSDVNRIMKEKGGFSGNLIWWSKLQGCFPQLTKVGVPVPYNNDAVLSLINRGYPVIVNVDGSPIGAPDHWVLFVGDKTLLDPWDGKGKPTSTYQVKQYVAIEVTSVDQTDYKALYEQTQVQIKDLKATVQRLTSEKEQVAQEKDNYKGRLSQINSISKL